MDPEASVCNPLDLEHMLIDETAEPRYLRISLLESITNNFTNDMVIGSGGFAVVYKGRLQNGAVAVKKMTKTLGVHETKFLEEFEFLTSVKHKNIVRFLGYCSDIQQKMRKLDNGQSVMAEEQQRFLCFEFLPWTLDKYIEDPSRGHDEWRTCYHIIKGICEGLHYLHKKKIVHLDLKPANILLDHDMVPKIADFGISKRFDENQTRVMTSNPLGTQGYIAPESYHGIITYKSDIYSLGIIIIKILTGNMWCPDVDNVLESWSVKMDTSPGDTQLEPVRVLAEIGIECTDFTPVKRPDTRRILERLDEMESLYGVGNESSSVSAAPSSLRRIIGVDQEPGGTSRKILYRSSKISRLLQDIHPLELHFPWEPNRDIRCPLTLTNRTDGYVGIWITMTLTDTPIFQATLKPHSTLARVMTMKSQLKPPDAMFEVLMVVPGSKGRPENLDSSIGSKLKLDSQFLKRVEKLGGEVYGATLKAVICDPASCQHLISAPLILFDDSIEVDSIEVKDQHPSETWILVCQYGGNGVSILNYETQKIEMAIGINRTKGRSIFSSSTWRHILSSVSTRFGDPVYVVSAKFIAQKQWFAVGDTCGWVHVYSYTTKDKVMEFKAYENHEVAENDHRVVSLAVHPKSPFLLTSCLGDYSIMLWDWSKGWECTRKFKNKICRNSYVTWNPIDSDTFISITSGAKVWNIHSSDRPVTILEGSHGTYCRCLYSDGHQNFMVTLERLNHHDGPLVKVWGLETKKLIHELLLRGYIITDLTCHPTLPILVTKSWRADSALAYMNTGTVCVWDARTYRLMKMVDFDSEIQDMVLNGTEDSTRLIVRCRKGISVMKINLPTLDMTDMQSDGWI